MDAKAAERDADALLAELKVQRPKVWMTITNAQGALISRGLKKICQREGIETEDATDEALLQSLLVSSQSSKVVQPPMARQRGQELEEAELRSEFCKLTNQDASAVELGGASAPGLTCDEWLTWDWLKGRVGPAGSSAIITLDAARTLWHREVGDVASLDDFRRLARILQRDCDRATSIQSALRGRMGRKQAVQSQAEQAGYRLQGAVKLAPFNPTPSCAVEQALDALQVAAGDTLYDLGCGDGRLLLAAARRGASAVGVEYDERFAERARAAIAEANLSDLATVICGDACASNLQHATKIFVYLVPDGLQRMEEALAAALRNGTPIASYTFSVPGWKPSQVLTADTRAPECKVWLYNTTEALPSSC